MVVSNRSILIATGALMGLIAVTALPPRECEREGPSPRSLSADLLCGGSWRRRPTTQADAVRRARDRLERALFRRRLVDSLAGRTRQAVSSPEGLRVFYEPPVRPDSARRVLASARREMASIPGAGRGTPVVVVLLSSPRRLVARSAGDSLRQRWRNYVLPPIDRFAVVDPGSPGTRTCYVVLDLLRVSNLDRYALLDGCALYGRFGEPGPHVSPWSGVLAAGWFARASFADRIRAWGNQPTREPTTWYGARSCLAGRPESCLQLVNLGGRRRGAGEAAWWNWNGEDPIRPFLTWLLAQGEPERFLAMWRSPQPVTGALAAAYGRSAGDLAHDWARASYEIAASRRAPGANPRVLLAGAFWASLALVAAFVAAGRRQAD